MESSVFAKLPEVVRIEPSSVCNLNCVHCPTGTSSSFRGVMSRGLFDGIVDRLGSVKPRVVVLYHGGEPFLNKEIFYMISVLKEHFHPFIKIVTNGMRIEEWMFEKIVSSGLDCIEFSLDGDSIEENDSIRVGCSAEKVLGNVDRLIQWKAKLGSPTPTVYVVNCVIGTEETLRSGVDNPTGMPEYLSKFVGVCYHDEIYFKRCYAIPWPGWRSDRFSTLHTSNEVSLSCEQLWEVMTIRYNGDVVSCCYDIVGNMVMGNITHSSIEEIWNNDLFVAMRRSIIDKNPFPMCSDCNRVRPGTFLIRKEDR